MIRVIILAAACLIGGASVAHAGIVAAAFTAIQGALAAGGFAAFAIRIVGGLALNAIGAALQKRAARRAAANQRDPGIRTSVTLTGGLNPDGMIAGSYATGGYLVAPPLEHGANNIYNSAVIDLSGVPLTGLERVFVNGAPIDLGADDAVIEGDSFGKPALGRFADHLWVKFYDGTQTAADPMLLARGGVAAPPDVAVWTERTSGTSNAINAVAYGNGLWVAVGDSGTILTSPDGVTWTARVSGTTNPLRDVIFAQGKFVACANVGFLESTDGITWSAVPFTGPYTTWRIAYANNTWVALAANAGNAVWTSEDFETWTVRLLPVGVGENFICKDIVFGNGVWVVVGSDDYNVGRIYTSANLTDWSLTSNGLLSTTAHYSVGFGDGEFVAGWQAEEFGTPPRVRVSPDGYTWTTRVLGGGVGGIIFGVGHGNGMWVAVGQRGTAPMLYTSQDAITWTERSLPIGAPNMLNNAAYAQNLWLVGGSGGAILTAGTFVPPTAATAPYPWSTDMVGIGRAYAICTYKHDREVWQGVPSFRFQTGSARFYDLRKDGSRGGVGAHRLDTPATWEGTLNPMVMVAHLSLGYFLPGALPGGAIYGGGYAPGQLPLADWAAAMNACDAQIAGLDGTMEAAWRAGLEISFEDDPLDAINAILQACDGEIVDRGGVLYPKVGAPALPVAFITDDDLIVSQPETLDPFPGLQQTINGVALAHPSPAAAWETVEAPRILRPDLELEDGDRRLIQALTIPACPYPGQIQRLGQALVRDARRWRRHILTLPRDLAWVRPLQTIAWTSARNGYDAKLFEMAEQVVDLISYDAQVTLREVDPADYGAQAYQPVNAALAVAPTPAPITLAGAGAEALTLLDANGDPRRPAIRAFWDGFSGAGVEVEVSRAGTIVSQTTAPASAGVAIISAEIIAAEVYSVRLRPVPAGAPVAYSGPFAVTAPNVLIGGADLTPASVVTAAIAAGSVTLSGVAEAGAVTNDATAWTAVATVTLASLPAAGFVNGTLEFRLTAGEADATDYPAGAEWRVTVAGVARRTIDRAEMLDRGGAHFTGFFTAASVGPGDVAVVFEIRGMGGLGVQNATLFAQAAMR
jgi:hypothetical protein